MLGPLKSRLARELGTSEVEFSLLISALSLNSTWTPLLGGVMASVLGTTVTSIIATGVVFGGEDGSCSTPNLISQSLQVRRLFYLGTCKAAFV